VKRALVTALAEAREAAGEGAVASEEDLLEEALQLARWAAGGPRRVINATGVVLHTNLGRAPLPPRAAAASARAGEGYGDLELDLATGRRGARGTRAAFLLGALTGAEDSLVVNNGAAALLLTFAALARRKDVVISRGELIEIGGAFRLPSIVSSSGARLLEVGTTNRTRLADYRDAVGVRTGAIVKVHPSNFRMDGFTSSVDAPELASLAGRNDVPFVYDVGSGLPAAPSAGRGSAALAGEPTLAGAVADGADLVLASGDKLLGGPQAGLIIGRADLITKLRRHPIARAVRVDKLQLAALESVLATHLRGDSGEIPVHRMVREPAARVAARAREVLAGLGSPSDGAGWTAEVERCRSVIGGGSVPGEEIASWGVRIRGPRPSKLAARLRSGAHPVLVRIEDDGLLLDLRTVTSGEIEALTRVLLGALGTSAGASRARRAPPEG
jgi:L-seryl-tRNA(Ser) seleniumtransferase